MYERSIDSTGFDLKLLPDSDLKTTNTGDLQTVFGAESIKLSLLRRLKTPELGYKRWVRSPTGLREIDSDYGNKLYNYLSSPKVYNILPEIDNIIREELAKESRIELVSLNVAQGDYLNDINITVVYKIKSDSELKTLTYTLNK